MKLLIFFLSITSVSFSQRNVSTIESFLLGEWFSCSDTDFFALTDVTHSYSRSMDSYSTNSSIIFEPNSVFSISSKDTFQAFFGSQIEYKLNPKKKIVYFTVNKMIIVYSYVISDKQLLLKLNQKEMKKMNAK